MDEKNQARDPDDERLETDFESFAEERQRSRMARDLKIGLAAIFALVVVLAVVLYNRLSPAKASPAASAEAQSEELQEAPKSGLAASEPETSPAAWSQPAIVPAIVGSADPRQGAPLPDLDSWSAPVEDRQVAKSDLDATTPLSPPSLAPKLVSVAPADRYAGYGGAEQVGAATAARGAEPSAGLEAVETGQTRDPLQGPPMAFGSGDAQAPAPGAPDSSGLHSPTTQVNLAPAPAFHEVSDSYPASMPEPNPLRTLTSAAEPIEESGPSVGPHAASQLGRPPQAFQGDAGQAPMPMAKAGPRPTDQTAIQPSDPTRQPDASGNGSSQAAPSPGLRFDGPAPAGRSRQPWASGGNVMQSDPTRPSLLGLDPTLAGAGQRDAGASAFNQEGTYVVQPNDNYWGISERLYGTGAYFKALAHHNRAKIPDEHQLQVGDVLIAPDASELHKAYPDLCPKPAHREAAQRRTLAGGRQTPIGPGRVYVVQEGDNLFDIARYELGKATRWTEIVDLNREALGANLDDLNYLTPGMKLFLPQDRGAGQLTRNPGSLYQR